MIGNVVVIDEAVDNEYTIVLITDSTLVSGTWTADYLLDENVLKTGRRFAVNELYKDTVWFSISDIYGNKIEVETELLFSGALGTGRIDRSDALRVWPNPASGELHLEAGEDLPVERVTVYSADGRPVNIPVNNDPISVIDLSTLPPGAYFIKVEWVNGTWATRKVIKN